MKKSPLQLNRSWIESLHLDTQDGDEGRSDEVAVSVDPSYSRNKENSNEWCVSLDVQIEAPEQGSPRYNITMRLLGIFSVEDPAILEESHLKLVAVNAPSILYSMAREIITNITARSKGVVVLPTISFSDITISPATDGEQNTSDRQISAKQ